MFDALLAGRPILVPQKMIFSQGFVSRYGEGFIVYDDLKETIEDILEGPGSELEASTGAAVRNANTFFIKNQVELAGKNFFNQEAV